MAVATQSSSAALVKAAVLPLILVLLAVAAGASNTEDGPAVAEAGGRFSETPEGRKLLDSGNLCISPSLPRGPPPDYNCAMLNPHFKIPHCCFDLINFVLHCIDAFIDFFNCGGCGKQCAGGQVCCSGVCVNPVILLTDKNNCGLCGRVCHGGHCKGGLCNY